jgi:hypothetical protein
MNRRRFLGTAAGAAIPAALSGAPPRPNILVILADDLGWSTTWRRSIPSSSVRW